MLAPFNSCIFNIFQGSFLLFLYICVKFFYEEIYLCRGIEMKDFQTPDKMSDNIKYLPDILKIHRTSFQRVFVLEFKCPQPVYLLKCIMTTFGGHQYSFCEINTYFIITFLLEKCYSRQKAIKQ